jgi:Galactose oxidase, central domain
LTVTTGTPGFELTANMTTGRYLHTGTLLNSGMVLLAGGLDGSGNSLASAELYDPITGTFTSTGSMTVTRYRHTATLLNNGKVLITGGELSGFGSPSPLASTELYDPTTGTFASTGSMTTSRVFHTATMLYNGKVLIAGGLDPSANGNVFLASAELYDPGTGTFALTGNMNNAREEHTATLMNNGLVLIAAGNDGTGGPTGFISAELYDPTNGIFATTGDPNTARSGQTAALLNDGEVLIASGYVPGGSSLTSAELYDPTTGKGLPTIHPEMPGLAIVEGSYRR